MKKKLYLIGGYVGDSLKRFFKTIDDADQWSVYVFEPHPDHFKKLLSLVSDRRLKNVELYQKAVSNTNGAVLLYPSDGQGSTIYRDKITGNMDLEHPIAVDAVRFVDFMRATSCKDDYVVVAINAEGAEYNILVDVHRSSEHHNINKLIVFWHSSKFRSLETRNMLFNMEKDLIKLYRSVSVDVRNHRYAFADNQRPRIVWVGDNSEWCVKFQSIIFADRLKDYEFVFYEACGKQSWVIKRGVAALNPDIVFCPFPNIALFLNDWEIVVQRLGSIRMFENGPVVGWLNDGTSWAFDFIAGSFKCRLDNYRHRKVIPAHRKFIDTRGLDLVVSMMPPELRMVNNLDNVVARLDGFRSFDA